MHVSYQVITMFARNRKLIYYLFLCFHLLLPNEVLCSLIYVGKFSGLWVTIRLTKISGNLESISTRLGCIVVIIYRALTLLLYDWGCQESCKFYPHFFEFF